MAKKFEKNIDKPIQKYRWLTQTFFVLVCIWIGVEFYLFINYLESAGTSTYYERPPGVESFLPISALMSIYYFIQTGIIHNAHPAGFFILLGVILVSLVFGKSFCSWICPVGTLSEYIGDFGDKLQKKLFKKVYRLPRWIDYPLRSLKYLLLAFFVYSIFFTMTILALRSFLDSPYNLIADVKMYYFFVEISRLALIIITAIFVLSIIVRNFWCRYLCPYGALLGITTLLSPNKIVRNADKCIDCSLCNKVCPSSIKVDSVKTVFSDECTTCLNCVDVCPVADTLELKNVAIKKKINKKYVAAGVIGVFVLTISIGMFTDNWQNDISKETYIELNNRRNSLGHPRSTEELEELNKTVKESYTNESTKK